MQVRDQLREIDAVAAEAMSLRSREQARRTAGSRRTGYEKALREVRTVAGREAAQRLADWIEREIRRTRALPPAREVRQEGGASAASTDTRSRPVRGSARDATAALDAGSGPAPRRRSTSAFHPPQPRSEPG